MANRPLRVMYRARDTAERTDEAARVSCSHDAEEPTAARVPAGGAAPGWGLPPPPPPTARLPGPAAEVAGSRGLDPPRAAGMLRYCAHGAEGHIQKCVCARAGGGGVNGEKRKQHRRQGF